MVYINLSTKNKYLGLRYPQLVSPFLYVNEVGKLTGMNIMVSLTSKNVGFECGVQLPKDPVFMNYEKEYLSTGLIKEILPPDNASLLVTIKLDNELFEVQATSIRDGFIENPVAIDEESRCQIEKYIINRQFERVISHNTKRIIPVRSISCNYFRAVEVYHQSANKYEVSNNCLKTHGGSWYDEDSLSYLEIKINIIFKEIIFTSSKTEYTPWHSDRDGGYERKEIKHLFNSKLHFSTIKELKNYYNKIKELFQVSENSNDGLTITATLKFHGEAERYDIEQDLKIYIKHTKNEYKETS